MLFRFLEKLADGLNHKLFIRATFMASTRQNESVEGRRVVEQNEKRQRLLFVISLIVVPSNQ